MPKPICGRCGAESPSGSRFCSGCGRSLTDIEEGVQQASGKEHTGAAPEETVVSRRPSVEPGAYSGPSAGTPAAQARPAGAFEKPLGGGQPGRDEASTGFTVIDRKAALPGQPAGAPSTGQPLAQARIPDGGGAPPSAQASPSAERSAVADGFRLAIGFGAAILGLLAAAALTYIVLEAITR